MMKTNEDFNKFKAVKLDSESHNFRKKTFDYIECILLMNLMFVLVIYKIHPTLKN